VDAKRLLIFREVGHAGSLSAAARSLGWTQPAVAQHVRRLERDTGVALLVRAGRGMAPTEAGRALLAHADAVAGRLAEADRDLAALADLRAGTVRLAAFPSASATLVPRALAWVRERHPGVDVRLVEAEPPEARRLLADGDVDLAVGFRHSSRPPAAADQDAASATFALLDDGLLVVVPPHSPFLAGRPALARLAAEPWIAGCERCRLHLVAVCAAAGFAPEIRHDTDDYVVTQRLVAAGLGVALLPGLAVAAAGVPGVALVEVPGAGVRHVHVVTGPAARASPAVEAMIAGLRTAAENQRGAVRSAPKPA
jgi:DNA-binding transcriptional LysR family regulator